MKAAAMQMEGVLGEKRTNISKAIRLQNAPNCRGGVYTKVCLDALQCGELCQSIVIVIGC
jgi:hypothetical protein